jgi:hypothetical protein
MATTEVSLATSKPIGGMADRARRRAALCA